MRFISLNTKLGEVVSQVLKLKSDIEELKTAEESFQFEDFEIVKNTLTERRHVLEEALEETGHSYQIILDKADKYDRLPEASAPMKENKLKTEGYK
ncbi:hypothetical protein ACTHQ4_02205 [Alkalicoccobacillus gibsonii]|uniref:hypothetical protein n=1 Tax=Alkalicoccobacillus gibsonii TaxID=79881 RepID=UPI003F7CC71C